MVKKSYILYIFLFIAPLRKKIYRSVDGITKRLLKARLVVTTKDATKF